MKIAAALFFISLSLNLLAADKNSVKKTPDRKVAGGENSVGGGNAYKEEFISTTKDALERLEVRGPVIVIGMTVDILAMKSKFSGTIVQPTTEKLFFKGEPVHALNYPDENQIRFNQDDWRGLSSDRKVLLVLHELWGLTFRKHSDEKYSFSAPLTVIVKESTVEDAVLAAAKIGMARPEKVRIQRKRTRMTTYPSNPEDPKMMGESYIVHAQTFENSSDAAVRIYEAKTDETGALQIIRMVSGEGPIGP